ncbi:MAG: temperature sensitive supressor [Deltaproteobacteria bacterium SG8_13]|nr:MAG: temperature sensitive supressor [Deltaproteobacteria bacterium SG8_13]
MKYQTEAGLSALDVPEVLAVLFHPRPELGAAPALPPSCDLMIPVEAEVSVGARFHIADESAPNILFFHGNGEIVADYHDLGALYNRMGINFLAVDYRGYGRSGGQPTVVSMMADCHRIFEFTRTWLHEQRHRGPLVVMGRSLGSASAIELASAHRQAVAGLVVESGFASAGPLLRLLGIDPATLGFDESRSFRNVDKINTVDMPTVIIHAEHDHIISVQEGQTLFDACGSAQKVFVKIPGANHNDIFMRGLDAYIGAVKQLTDLTLAAAG